MESNSIAKSITILSICIVLASIISSGATIYTDYLDSVQSRYVVTTSEAHIIVMDSFTGKCYIRRFVGGSSNEFNPFELTK